MPDPVTIIDTVWSIITSWRIDLVIVSLVLAVILPMIVKSAIDESREISEAWAELEAEYDAEKQQAADKIHQAKADQIKYEADYRLAALNLVRIMTNEPGRRRWAEEQLFLLVTHRKAYIDSLNPGGYDKAPHFDQVSRLARQQ